jgi:hypothetical protein
MIFLLIVPISGDFLEFIEGLEGIAESGLDFRVFAAE